VDPANFRALLDGTVVALASGGHIMKNLSTALYLVAALAGSACGGGGDPAGDAPSGVKKIEGAPASGAAVNHAPVITSSPPAVLSALRGQVAIGTGAGLSVASLGDASVNELLVVADTEAEPKSTGAIQRLARRRDGGVLALADNGLFHDEGGLLLTSPLGSALNGMPIKAMSAFGEGAEEELWITSDTGALHVGGGQLTAVSIPDVKDTPDAVVGAEPDRALLTAGGDVFLIDFKEGSATKLSSDLGAVHGFDRSDDGTVYLATDAGLFTRTRDGALSLYTFAAPGAERASILAVSAAFGGVLVATSTQLLSVGDEGATLLGDLTQATPGGLATDANGDAWVIDDGNLVHYKNGDPVSFAKDVVPFFAEHCASCHKEGQGAPEHDFEDFATAKDYAAQIARKLTAPAGMGVMPPASVETLRASDYAVVIRWIGSGQAP
jgi:hypothetical protein